MSTVKLFLMRILQMSVIQIINIMNFYILY